MQEIAVIKQLPIITEKIKEIGSELDERIKSLNLDNLVCNEDTKKEIKNLKANLSKELTEFEKQRKLIKEKIIEPYEEFNEIYEKEIKAKYKSADMVLKSKIDEVESAMKQTKETEVKNYFNELVQAMGLEFVKYSQMNLVVNLSTSTKSLKETIKANLEKIKNDLDTIKTMEQTEELEVEYRRTFDLGLAIKNINERKELLKIVHEKQEKVEEPKKEVNDSLDAPIEGQISIDDLVEKKYSMTFRVIGTINELKKIKEFMESEGIKYEQCK